MTRYIPFIFVLLWSTGFVGAKYALPFAEPFTILALRSAITIAALVLIWAVLKSRAISQEEALQQSVIGMLIHGAYLGGVFFAISKGFPAGLAAIIVGLQPIITAIFSSLFMGEKIAPLGWLGLWLGFIGIVLVIIGREGAAFEADQLAGMGACAAALIGISAGTVLQKRWGKPQGLVVGSLWQYIGAIMVFVPLSFAIETREVHWQPQLIAALLWLVFGLSIAAIFLLMIMIREGEASKVASYFYFVPPLVLLESWLLFDERLSMISLIGTMMVVIAVAMVVRRGDAKAK